MKTSTIIIENIGSIILQKSKRAKHLNISIRPFKGVRVSVPYGMSFKKAEKIVHDKIAWIEKHQKRMRQIEVDHQLLQEESEEIDKDEAKRILIGRLNELANKNSFSYNRMTIRNQKTRWGSCSQKNSISLNAKLVKLPQELIDYVILHELVHTKIKNHSKKFWDELNNYIPNAKGLDKELRKYGAGLL
jgi:predicted metal-dependent hydrolase